MLLADHGQAIAAVVVPDGYKYRDGCRRVIEVSRELDIPTITTLPTQLSKSVTDLEFNMIFSCGYPFRVPELLLKRVHYAINFHPTLLPRHRGRYLHWIILEGDRESGVTAHFMDNELDTGAIVRQMRFPVSKFDTVESLLRKVLI